MTLPSRRLLLAASAALLVTRHAGAENVRDRPARMALEPNDPDRVMFSRQGLAGAVAVPQSRARIAFVLPIAGRDVAGIAFAADTPDTTTDLVALVGWDGAMLRILGLEVLKSSGPDGARLSSRFAGVGDRTRLSITRTAANPRPGLPKRWESFTDYLAWHALSPLADAPVRAPLPGTRQAALSAVRATVIGLLSPPCQAVGPDLLAAFAA